MADRPGVEPDELRQIVAEHLARLTGLAVSDIDVDEVLHHIDEVTQRFPNGASLARVGDHVTEVRITADD
ncbi:MAG TPA: hypothetical protein VMM60_18915 [Ilumatobacter sp.]|nr:hypothetical protein [Ilumatobacter sp.]